jgi:RNA polymerase sigma factor (sigma-70 family)
MPELLPFQELIQRAEAHDQEACAELVRLFEDDILQAVHAPIFSMGLQSLIDPTDICQAVFASFFTRVLGAPYDLSEPHKVRQLLVTMARNKVADEGRRHTRHRRNRQRQAASDDCLHAVADCCSTPSSIAVKRETLETIFQHLSDEERYLVEQRAQGREWAVLAAKYGVSPEALRKKLDRAITRVTRQLGM